MTIAIAMATRIQFGRYRYRAQRNVAWCHGTRRNAAPRWPPRTAVAARMSDKLLRPIYIIRAPHRTRAHRPRHRWPPALPHWCSKPIRILRGEICSTSVSFFFFNFSPFCIFLVVELKMPKRTVAPLSAKSNDFIHLFFFYSKRFSYSLSVL